AASNEPPPVASPSSPREPAAAPVPAAAAATRPVVSEIAPARPRVVEPVAGETVRISVQKLEARLVESEEMLNAKLCAAQRVAELDDLAHRFESWRQAWVAADRDVRALSHSAAGAGRTGAAPEVARLVEFYYAGLETLHGLRKQTVALARGADHDRHSVSRLVDDLLEDSKRLLLLPISTVSLAFPKLVRDLCRDQGKEAELVMRGDEIEIDKRILEEIKDPLVHLLRNSV